MDLLRSFIHSKVTARVFYLLCFTVFSLFTFSIQDIPDIKNSTSMGIPFNWICVLLSILLLHMAFINSRNGWSILFGIAILIHGKFSFDVLTFLIDVEIPNYMGSAESLGVIGSVILGAIFLFILYVLKPLRSPNP